MPNDKQAERRTRARIRRLGALPSSPAVTWVACFAVVAGIFLVVAVIGFLFITRGTAVRRVRTPVSPAEATFPLAVALLTGSPIVAGNRVELALNGDGTYPRLWADLRSARRAITVQMYYVAPGRVRRLVRCDPRRARAGRSVRVPAVRRLRRQLHGRLPGAVARRRRARAAVSTDSFLQTCGLCRTARTCAVW